MKVDVRARVESKVSEIRQTHPSVSIDYLIMDSEYGDWGLIIFTDYSFTAMGLDFFESEESWKRPEAVDQYNGLIGSGYCVVVYAPSEVMGALVNKMRRENGRSNIRLASYDQDKERHRTLKEAIELLISR